MVVTSPPDNWVPPITFSDRLVLLRRHLDLNVETLAPRCGISPSTWYSWENGAQPRGLVDVVVRIAAATGCDRNWLMWGGIDGTAISQELPPLFVQEALFAAFEAA